MSKRSVELEGKIEYTPRALRMDAHEAMGRDIVRGIIELVTNADDSYARLGGRGVGKIWIGVDHSRKGPTWNLVVRDRAEGMRRETMLKGLARIAARTSGFESGLAVRGNRGRGAKDLVAFGEVTFESIHDDIYSSLVLRRDGTWSASKERRASNEDRSRLRLPRGTGTVVTLRVLREFTCPRNERLRELISRDFQLRDVMADSKREVRLAKINAEDVAERLRYEVDEKEMSLLVREKISISEYPDAGDVILSVWRLPSRCDSPPSDRTRSSGILVCGRRAIYDNSLFKYETSPYGGLLTGRIDCPYIDQLEREFDDRDERGEPHPDKNSIPIVSRRRQGLAPDHLFTKALAAAIETALQPLIDALEEEGEGSRCEGKANRPGGEGAERRVHADSSRT